jgi:ubiquitin carboxyl-terminal hydrolase 16/45
VYCNASKQFLIFSPPLILTLHLKRFHQTLAGPKKVTRHVVFPLELDLAPFCTSTALALPNLQPGQTQVGQKRGLILRILSSGAKIIF